MNYIKTCLKSILLAQAASDSGKGIDNLANNSLNAVKHGYNLKDEYIFQAIKLAWKTKGIVKVSRGYEDRWNMDIIYFDIAWMGQVSFHSHCDYSKIVKKRGWWNGIRGGSQETCRKVANRYKLPYYK